MVSQNQRLESLKKGWMYGLRTHHGDWQVGFHLGFWRGGPLLDVAFAGGYICFNLKDPKAQKEVLVCAASLLKTADKWKWYQNEHAVHLGFVCANPIPQPNNLPFYAAFFNRF